MKIINLIFIMENGFVHQIKATDSNYERAAEILRRRFINSMILWQCYHYVSVSEKMVESVDFTGEYEEVTDTLRFYRR